jgi:Holliday junction resolvase RusA-like endonuclease
LTELTLCVPGDAVPWAPKTGNPRMGGRFVPARQSAHAGKVIDAWDRVGHTGWLLGEPLAIDCEFYVRRPKSHYGSGRNERIIKERFAAAAPTGRPDLSNLVKLIEDALTTLAWADDDQIVRITARKTYTRLREEQPRSVIRIREAD